MGLVVSNTAGVEGWNLGRIIALVGGASLLGAGEIGLRVNVSMGSTGEANDFIFAVPKMEPVVSKNGTLAEKL